MDANFCMFHGCIIMGECRSYGEDEWRCVMISDMGDAYWPGRETYFTVAIYSQHMLITDSQLKLVYLLWLLFHVQHTYL